MTRRSLPWTLAEDAIIRTHAARGSREIAAMLGRTEGGVGERARKIGQLLGKADPNNTAATPEGFMQRVEFDTNGGCWLWTGGQCGPGYGVVNRRGVKNTTAHRHAYTLFRGSVPDGLVVCHRCDVPACVNPDHLWLGTDKQNSDDKWAKGRANPVRRFTAEEVVAIRSDSRHQADIAAEYGCTQSSISLIKLGKSYRSVGGEIVRRGER